MKMKLSLIIITSLLLLNACGNKEDNLADEPDSPVATAVNSPETAETISAAKKDVIEIKENVFISLINDIYLNTEDYLGKTIKYEGLFDSYYWPEEDTTYYYVIRYGPGCCGSDGNAGFEIFWDGEYPQLNDWVEVVGVLETYEENGYEYLRLRLSSLNILDERGSEYVASK